MGIAMHILLAPDKFKGSLDAAGVRAALRTGLTRVRPDLTIIELPLADGGDGSVAALLACGWQGHALRVAGPVGATVEATYAQHGNTAFVELAACCGMARLCGPAPLRASTGGLGAAMRAAVAGLHSAAAGRPRLIVGLGGSASTDGGAGLLQALGADLTDAGGAPIRPGLEGLRDLAHVDLRPARAVLRGVTLDIASDVTAPLTGPDGAAAVFGPQKGLRDIASADRALTRLAAMLGLDPALPGAGAAGGAGAALLALGGRMRSGAGLILRETGAEQAIAAAGLVITGEGRMDAQSLMGKAPLHLAALARARGTAVIGVCGTARITAAQAGLDALHALTDLDPDPARCIAAPAPLLARIGARIAAGLA